MVNTFGFLAIALVTTNLLLFSQSSQCSQNPRVRLTIFNGTDCNPSRTQNFVYGVEGGFRSHALTFNRLNGDFGDYISFHPVGLWKAIPCETVGHENRGCDAEIFMLPQYSKETTNCMNYVRNETKTVIRLQQFGSVSQDKSSVNLYPQANLTGEGVHVSETSQNLEEPLMTAASYYIEGTTSWSVYEKPWHIGKSTCLRPSNEVLEQGYGFTVGNLPFLTDVGSVALGCNYDPRGVTYNGGNLGATYDRGMADTGISRDGNGNHASQVRTMSNGVRGDVHFCMHFYWMSVSIISFNALFH